MSHPFTLVPDSRSLRLLACLLLVPFATSVPAVAQLESNSPTGTATSPYDVQLGEGRTVKYQIGTRIQTANGAFGRVKIILPVPAEWPEQSVSIVDESIYEKAGDIEYRILDGGIRQMMVGIPLVPANTQAEVLITYEVNISPILPPSTTEGLIRPEKRTKELAMALGDSPMIFSRNRDLRKQVNEIIEDDQEQPAWEVARILHQWVIENIRETVTKPQSTVDTLEQKQGCNEDRAALFVAMSRAAKIPARMVMVEGSQHAEFCLEDPEGETHWYPCTFRGSGEFGSVARPAVVFQKGDNLRMPEQRQRQRLIAEYVNGRGARQPRVEIVRKVVQ